MFDFKAWLKQDGLINGYRSGEFSYPGVVTMTANYISRGMLDNTDAADIDTACKKIDADKAAAEAAATTTDTSATSISTTQTITQP